MLSFLLAAALLSQTGSVGIRRYPGGGRPVMLGAARVDITPSTPIRLAGYAARKSETAKIAQRLFAKALVIGGDDAGSKPVVLVTVDSCGVPKPVVDEVARRLTRAIGLPRDRLVVSSSHTHSAPALRGYAPMLFDGPLPAKQKQHVDDYTDGLIEKLVEVVETAMRGRRLGRLAWAQGQVRFAANRRGIKNGKWTGFTVQAGAPVDHDLPVLRATDADGRLVAVVANYACHCTTAGLDDGVCGDWAGYGQQYVEERHPGAVAMITIGCGGDANPQPRGTLAAARANGRWLADEVERLLDGNAMPLDPSITTKLRWIELPFAKPPDRAHWLALAGRKDSFGYHARTNLARLEHGPLPTHLDYPVATWSFGDDLLFVFLGGEVVVDYALELQRRFDSRRLWITSYSNDVPCYIPSRRILAEGGYEADSSMVYYDRPTRFADAVETILLDAVEDTAPASFLSNNRRADTPSPRSPEQSLAAMTLPRGFKVDLVASEPLIVDPVAFDWGPDGRLWVVEMRDYPSGIDGKGKPGGRVKVLVDDDGDGDYDSATVFADGLPYPTGIKVWKNGVLIAAAPDILYAEDSDGDGRADIQRKLYTGFGEGNQQHRVNGLRPRLDNWLQVANGDSGGRIRSLTTGDSADVRGRDLRIEVDTGRLDPQSGQTQYGTARDDWGNWFGGNNSIAIWHYVLSDHYLRRNPHVRAPSPRNVLAGTIAVFPTSRTLERFNDPGMRNRVTSACSPMLYRDEGLGPEVSWFVCEPVHNLVLRQALVPKGVTFESSRLAREREFLTSSDNWFRPAMVRTGPDGAIWIADMYRFVIEHPRWIPPRWQKILDIRAGDDRGRIYRVRPPAIGRHPLPRLDRLTTRELVAVLESSNGWLRDMAQEMLVWRNDRAAVAPLQALARSSLHPLARLHALYTLAGLDALTPEQGITALHDPHPGVRRHAIVLSERFVDSAPLLDALVALTADDDPHVRMQLAYTLGQWKGPAAGTALAQLAARDGKDPYMRAAIMSSAVPHCDRMLLVLLGDGATADNPMIGGLLATAAASRDPVLLRRVAAAVTRSDRSRQWRLEAASQILDAVQGPAADLMGAFTDVFASARAAIAANDVAITERVAAASLLGREASRADADLRRLTSLLRPATPISLQLAAITAIARIGPDDGPALLLAGWSGHSPRVRHAILDALTQRASWASRLLDTIARKPELARSIDPARRAGLMTHASPAVATRAKQLWRDATTSSREAVVERYLATTKKIVSVDSAKGRAVFAKNCAVCHRLLGIGNAIGPDIATLTDRSPRALLVAVLDPNRAVESKYLNYIAELKDGRTLAGVIGDETGTSVTLHGIDGTATTILRRDLKKLTGTGRSLMPEGLDAAIDPHRMADLIHYLRTLGPKPKSFPNNHPELILPDDSDVLTLPAAKAAIFGPRIVFEQRYRNLGYWQNADDRGVWTIETFEPGRYRVELDFACAKGDAGNAFQVVVGSSRLTGRVASTGTWDVYKRTTVGEIQLHGDVEDVVIRSVGALRGALIDLRTVRLIPVTGK